VLGGRSAPGIAESHPGALFRRGAGPGASRSAANPVLPDRHIQRNSSQLAALNAVTASYPLRGHVRIADAPFGVARTTDRVTNRGRSVWIDARIHRPIENRARVALEDRCSLVSSDASARTTAGSGHGLRESRPAALLNYDDVASTELIRARQPCDLRRPVRRSRGPIADFREYFGDDQGAGRAVCAKSMNRAGSSIPPSTAPADFSISPASRHVTACRGGGSDGRQTLLRHGTSIPWH